jgi:tetratricopeptide (TPR) repeat protein
VLLGLKRFEEAAESFDAYLSKQGEPTALVYRCRALARQKAAERLAKDEPARSLRQAALADLTLALALAPDDPSLYEQRGQAYLASGAAGLAAGDFDEALRRGKPTGGLHLRRGLARLRLGKLEAAAADAHEAARLADGPHDLCGAACLVASVARETGGPSSNRRERELRRAHQERAVEMLLRAMALLPPSKRAEFWQKTVRAEASLRPLLSAPGLAELERRYSRPMAP